jgi:protein SCO1/2
MSDTSVPTTSGFRAPPVWVVLLFIAFGVGALVAAFFIPLKPPEPKPPEAKVIPPGYDSAPPFVLTERLGGTVDNTTLDGKVWVASFAFTRCKYCPEVSSTMAKLRKELNLSDRDRENFRLVTFTIDPDYDTPDELKKYADKYTGRENDPTWLFLHGPERFIRLLCTRGFKVGVEKKEGVDVSLMYDHFLGLMVIDKNGRVRGKYLGKQSAREGSDADVEAGKQEFDRSYAELKEKITELLAEPVMTDSLPPPKSR